MDADGAPGRAAMLVLKCDRGESVILTTAEGLRIEVKVTGTEPGAAYLGFDAPDSVNIVRSEVARDPHQSDSSD